jgi:hypothetical protein
MDVGYAGVEPLSGGCLGIKLASHVRCGFRFGPKIRAESRCLMEPAALCAASASSAGRGMSRKAFRRGIHRRSGNHLSCADVPIGWVKDGARCCLERAAHVLLMWQRRLPGKTYSRR